MMYCMQRLTMVARRRFDSRCSRVPNITSPPPSPLNDPGACSSSPWSPVPQQGVNIQTVGTDGLAPSLSPQRPQNYHVRITAAL